MNTATGEECNGYVLLDPGPQQGFVFLVPRAIHEAKRYECEGAHGAESIVYFSPKPPTTD